MYSVSDLRKGLKLEIDGTPFLVTEFSFMKPGKGQAVYTCRLKNMISGTTMMKNFRSNEKFDECKIDTKELSYSYGEGEYFYFMDKDYEEVMIPAAILGNGKYFLSDDIAVEAVFHNGNPIEVTLPNFVEQEVAYTEPGVRGDTATNVNKPAKMSSGYELQVPLFVNLGDMLKIDTRTGEYADRVLKA